MKVRPCVHEGTAKPAFTVWPRPFGLRAAKARLHATHLVKLPLDPRLHYPHRFLSPTPRSSCCCLRAAACTTATPRAWPPGSSCWCVRALHACFFSQTCSRALSLMLPALADVLMPVAPMPGVGEAFVWCVERATDPPYHIKSTPTPTGCRPTTSSTGPAVPLRHKHRG